MFSQDEIKDETCHPIEIVIKKQKNATTKHRLKKFWAEGIEKDLHFVSKDTHYDSVAVDVEKIIATAKSYLGTPHHMGGLSKRGIDCSGMVLMSLKSSGILTPHNSHDQARFGRVIPHTDSLKRGDLVFFINSFRSSYLITHSGIYIGNNKFIHASVRGGVSITDLSMPYWATKFVFGTRIKE